MNRLPDWIADPALRPVWAKVLVRFEQAGLEPQGRVRVEIADRAQRHALGALLGRTLTGDRVQLDLAMLDARLAARSGVGGLEPVLTALFGHVPQDRPGQRAARRQARDGPLQLAARLSRTHLDAAEWTSAWIEGLRTTGVLTGRTDAERIVEDAVTVLAALTGASAQGSPTRSRVELGATMVGDAHALDPDRVLHGIVLRGLACVAGVRWPESARDRDALWAEFGVQPDLLSRTALVWRLRAEGDGPTAGRFNDACAAGDPVHVTEWDLRRLTSVAAPTGARVLICENPRVLEAFAEGAPEGWSAVCTAGEPNLVVDRVLLQLAAQGAELRYHGDFDWAGISIANRVIGRTGARPWLMASEDYLRAVRDTGPALEGRPVTPAWDTTLLQAMQEWSRAVHEESVLTELLAAAHAAGTLP
jgi:uncharacterized protein (TIGR02679 family)